MTREARRGLSSDGPVTSKFEQLAYRGGRSAWELSHAITGSVREAEEVLGAVLNHTLPRIVNASEEVFRSELLISAGESAALAVYSPFSNGSQPRANNGPRRTKRAEVDPGVLWLESAFRKQLPWYLQTLLWAVEVERLPGAPMERRLSLPRHSEQRAQQSLIRAFMGSAAEVAPERACLQRVWAACRNGHTKRSTARHAATCEWCAAQLDILLNLGEALPKLAKPMPDSVWKERWEPVEQSVAQWQAENLVTPGSHSGGTGTGSSQPGRRGIIVTAALIVGVSIALVLGVRGAHLTTELAGGAPQLPLSTASVGNASAAHASAASGAAIESATLAEEQAAASPKASLVGATSLVPAGAVQPSGSWPGTTGATGRSSSSTSGAGASGSGGGVATTPSSPSAGAPGPSRGGKTGGETVAVGPATASVATDPSSACGSVDVDGQGTGSCLGFAQAPWFLVEMGSGAAPATSDPAGPAPIVATAPADSGATTADSLGATVGGVNGALQAVTP